MLLFNDLTLISNNEALVNCSKIEKNTFVEVNNIMIPFEIIKQYKNYNISHLNYHYI